MTEVYMYTRVSTELQSDNFSLPAQRQTIKKYAEYMGYKITREYCDNGKSGKNAINRPQFMQMMEDIENGKDKVKYVIVFKLSRFGRNAADTLFYLQLMQDYGVNLISVNDNLNSGVATGKIMISILSAMAELERENILEQTMSGRRQKATDGKWNGGRAGFGFELINGELKINEDEARIVRDIFNIYISSPLGIPHVAKELNLRYKKEKKRADSTEKFSRKFVQDIIENPIYVGQIAYGRRTSAKIEGKRNEYHVIKQTDSTKIIIAKGQHEAIIDTETWEKAQAKRIAQSGVKEKLDPSHHYIFSTLVKCPGCGGTMYGRPNGKKYKKDGTMYDISYSYVCRSSSGQTGHVCTHKTQYGERKLEQEVKAIIVGLINNDNFSNLLTRTLSEGLDVDKLRQDIDSDKKELRRLEAAQERTEALLLDIDYTDAHAERREQSLQRRLDAIFDQMQEAEKRIAYAQERIDNAEQKDNAKTSIYEFLEHFQDFYDDMEDVDRKAILCAIIESIELYPKNKQSGQWIKAIHFNFPLLYQGEEIVSLHFSPSERHVETVVLLSREKADDHIRFSINTEDLKKNVGGYATYGDIKAYVLEKFGLKVSSLYIAQTKDKCGIKERENYYIGEGKSKELICPPEKEQAIMDAFRHFGMLRD